MQKKRYYLWGEFILLYLLVPLLIYLLHNRTIMIAALWSGAAACAFYLFKAHDFNHKSEWNFPAAWLGGASIIARCSFVALLMAAFCYWLTPDHLFYLPRLKPQLWIIIMIVYPLLSAIPQEIIFRSFFFHRYRALFPKQTFYIVISAIAFGYMHIIFGNWIAVSFTGVGGLLLAYTYFRHRSLALVCFEHALYGCSIFTIGLGQYFFNH